MESKVFIPERSNQLSAETETAVKEAYGEIVYIFGPRDRRPGIFSTEHLCHTMMTALEKHGFDPVRDCVCMTGNMVMLTNLTLTILGHYGTINVLMYVSTNGTYVKRTFNNGRRYHGEGNQV